MYILYIKVYIRYIHIYIINIHMIINTSIIFINVYFTEVTITTKALKQSEWKINFQEKKCAITHFSNCWRRQSIGKWLQKRWKERTNSCLLNVTSAERYIIFFCFHCSGRFSFTKWQVNALNCSGKHFW